MRARRKPVLAALLVATALASAVGAAAAAAPPLTKDDYFLEFARFEGTVDEVYGPPYYSMALDPHPPAKCANKLRRMNRRLRRVVAQGHQIVPPPEIQGLHDRLLSEGDRVLRRFEKTVTPVARGKLTCGDGYPGPDVSVRLYDIYSHSPVDKILQKLAEGGYRPSGY